MILRSHQPVSVRAYVEEPGRTPIASRPRKSKLDIPSRFTLAYDCETDIGPGQGLRVGFYQVREYERLHEEGLFYDPEGVCGEDLRVIKAYAAQHRLTLHTVRSFVEEVFLKYGYYRRGTIVGFNLPFDLSRLAIRHAPARGHMHGGWSFQLSENSFAPALRIKYLSRRAALIDFTIGEGQTTPRGMRKQGHKVPAHRGYFIDLKTLAGALANRNFSLAALCDFLSTKTRKAETDKHGGPITPEYLDYARTDVQVTWECYVELMRRYRALGLDTPAHRILSEASIGKACLRQMGVFPLLQCQPDFPRDLFGKIMCAYYGGRAEVRIRREIREVRYCDFKAMYPTVNSLMGLWRFVIANGLTWRDATSEARDLLRGVKIDDLQSKAFWPRLTMIVRLKPNGDLLPVRSKYDGKSNTIGLNHLTCEESLWFPLADLIAAKILSGETPEIEAAILFEPGPVQAGLKPINLLGRSQFHVDPYGDDGVFKRLVDLRDKASKADGDAIKIINNAMSYGISIEINRDDAAKCEELNVFGPGGHRSVRKVAIEEPGRFYNPILGVAITGAARLMLALAERRVTDEGLEWVFCDTDSLAIARPEGMARAGFLARVDRVVCWFEPLNRYAKPGSILKVEDLNFDPTAKSDRPLLAFAISAKRYCLFNLDGTNRPLLRKASQHGLGHLLSPYETGDEAEVRESLGIAGWQRDLWARIVEVALSGNPDRVALDYHPNFQRPALSRYGATTPDQLGWFELWNVGKPYHQQVKPFNFLTSLMMDTFLRPVPEDRAEQVREPGRPRKSTISPVAPFDPDAETAALKGFDRKTGAPVSPADLKTYQVALRNYHLSCESKFENGEFLDQGPTRRRHIVATEVRLIGKEANRVDIDEPGDGPADYGSSTDDTPQI